MTALRRSEEDIAHQCEGASLRNLCCGTVTLRDGRVLAYHEEGSGVPVVALHGMFSSRLHWLQKTPVEVSCPGVRLIALDRPGYGGSSAPPLGYNYTAFAQDLAEFADALELPRFCVTGHSSGGPNALAAAAILPDRVVAAALISSDAPYADPNAPPEVTENDPFVSPWSWKACIFRFEAKLIRRGMLCCGKTPQMKYPAVQGVDGILHDWMIERAPYSFAPQSISLGSRLSIWVGSDDEFQGIPFNGTFLQTLVTGSQLHIVEGGGHDLVSEPKHFGAILQGLVASWEP